MTTPDGKTPITKQEFQHFAKECKRWVREFGLQHYALYCVHEHDDENEAWTLADIENGLANIGLATEVDSIQPVTKQTLTQTAFHETQELLLWRVRELLSVFYSEKKVSEELHYIIRSWENFVFKKG